MGRDMGSWFLTDQKVSYSLCNRDYKKASLGSPRTHNLIFSHPRVSPTHSPFFPGGQQYPVPSSASSKGSLFPLQSLAPGAVSQPRIRATTAQHRCSPRDVRTSPSSSGRSCYLYPRD